MKIDEALRVLPVVEALGPLRAVLLSHATSSGAAWDSEAAYQTIGRRDVAPKEVRSHLDALIPRARDHLAELWSRYLAALEHLDAGEGGRAVDELLRSGHLEQAAGRTAPAREWYTSAIVVAERLPERRPELDALLARGRLSLFLGYYEDSARDCQRAFAIAEAEFENAAAIEAAKGLGDVSVERGAWAGAQVWYVRALRLAEAAGDAAWIGRVQHAHGDLARRRGDTGAAIEALHTAQECFEQLGDTHEIARVLATQGLTHAQAGLHARASAALLEAVAWLRRGPPDHALDAFIHQQVARVYVDQRRYLEADEELRRAEAIAIGAALTRRLAQVYAMLGRMRGLQGDETGFVFFEQALTLTRGLDPSPLVEAQVYHDYAHFKHQFGQHEEAAAYLDLARKIFETLGATAELETVRLDLARVASS